MTLKVSQRYILRKTKPGMETWSKNRRLRWSSSGSLVAPINKAKTGEDEGNYVLTWDIYKLLYRRGLEYLAIKFFSLKEGYFQSISKDEKQFLLKIIAAFFEVGQPHTWLGKYIFAGLYLTLMCAILYSLIHSYIM